MKRVRLGEQPCHAEYLPHFAWRWPNGARLLMELDIGGLLAWNVKAFNITHSIHKKAVHVQSIIPPILMTI
jgi:hypothetical protein